MFRISEDRAVVQTVDFFTPIVDDPYDYGQIAAANALSDVYAMGGTPITVMNILCYPIATRDINEMGAILRGGSDKVAESGAVLVGGHSVDDPEPKYGLAVTGLIDPNKITTNAGAVPGDRIVLTKPLSPELRNEFLPGFRLVKQIPEMGGVQIYQQSAAGRD